IYAARPGAEPFEPSWKGSMREVRRREHGKTGGFALLGLNPKLPFSPRPRRREARVITGFVQDASVCRSTARSSKELGSPGANSRERPRRSQIAIRSPFEKRRTPDA